MRAGQIPALAAAALLHAGVLAALMYLNLGPRVIEVVPTALTVSLVPKGPSAAPVIGPPQPEEAAPAEAEETPPEPTPATPAPPALTSPPQVTAKPVKPTPTPTKKPAPEVDPCELVGSCATPNRQRARPVRAGQSGGAAPQTGERQGPVTDPREANGLVNKVVGLWYLQCDIGETRRQVVKVQFKIDGRGYLVGNPEILNRSAKSVFGDAANGAVRALKAAAPFSVAEAPMNLRNVPIVINFKASMACQGH